MRPGRKPWTEKDEAYLEERWGTVSIPSIAKRLGRTEAAVKVRAGKLRLGPFIKGGEYVSLNVFLKSIGYTGGNTYKLKSWVKNRGFPIHEKIVNTSKVRVVYIDEFWEWAEQHRSFLDFSKIPPLILGKEPAWVAEQRKKDGKTINVQRKDPWTWWEDDLLKSGIREGKTYMEIATEIHRTCGAIVKRCNYLKLQGRPVRKGPHDTVWTTKEIKVVEDGIMAADTYMQIGERVNRSEKAVRGLMGRLYGTEDMDKLRQILKAAG